MISIKTAALPMIAGLACATVHANVNAYPYSSATFSGFVRDSYREAGHGQMSDFFKFFEASFKRASGTTVATYLADAKAKIKRAKDADHKTAAQIEIARNLHGVIKRTIPKFNLDRGFEFYNTTTLGERQCFLQSVLIAGLLQQAGMDAGVAMVYKNEKGQPSNNGHAITLLQLASKNDIVVDASEPYAFAKHQGLFLRWPAGGYRYVEPTYSNGPTPFILAFKLASNMYSLPAKRFLTLDVPFLRSQFDYYRGERAINGFLAKKQTLDGLKASNRYLSRAVSTCPQNSLALSVLARVQEKLGQQKEAISSYRSAMALYSKFGWTAGGVQEAMDRAVKGPAKNALHRG